MIVALMIGVQGLGALLCARSAQRRNRHPIRGFLLGFLCGPIAYFVQQSRTGHPIHQEDLDFIAGYFLILLLVLASLNSARLLAGTG